MKKTGFLKQLYYCYLSKPASDRAIYRLAAELEINSILEIGISSLERTCRLIEISHRFCEQPIQYTGIDMFEAGAEGTAKVGLKLAHVELKKTGARVKLTPGDPYSSLSRSANLLSNVDLLLVGSHVDEMALSRSWFYIPRILKEDACVMIERTTAGGKTAYDELTVQDVQALAEKPFQAKQQRSHADSFKPQSESNRRAA